jgi:hypothetical protein
MNFNFAELNDEIISDCTEDNKEMMDYSQGI